MSVAGVSDTDDPAVVSSVLDGYESLVDVVTSEPPPEVVAAIATGIPTSVYYSLLDDPAGIYTETEVPDYFSELPPVVQSYAEERQSAAESVLSSLGYTYTEGIVLTSAEIETASEFPATETEESTATETEESTFTTTTSRTTTDASDDELSSVASSSRPIAAEPSVESFENTSNPAARPTGAVAASMAGLVAVLGVAAIL